MPFETVTLNDGNKMPAIAFGTGSKWKGQDVTEYVEQAIETGFSHIDTAQWYANEDSVGKAIRESALERSELFITTKWSGLTSIPDALGLKQIDLYLIHNPNAGGTIEGNWREFEKIKEEALAKSIGPAVNQIFFHPYNYAQNKELLEFSTKHGIVTEAYSSLAPITRFPGGPVDKPVQAAAKRLNATPTQVILSWVRSKGVVIVTTSSSKEHLQEYLTVADLPPLTEEEIAAIDEAGAKGPSTIRTLVRSSHIRLAISVFQMAVGLWGVYRVWRCYI
ncbi:NADPH-dependent conjugated polyketone reductase C1 [Grifola frondosa]|uniref:NADPH-dependent conjugated polyketone reductase C1 n=1 Tax=Grifola frondosa TaxID=5627 RepID=A0A1C7M537_GRIFR|nr:NADPH-dependent conjugated polyketone reductase C1 [Grifola frondosa]